MLSKEHILVALRAWIRQRPGLEFCNYGELKSLPGRAAPDRKGQARRGNLAHCGSLARVDHGRGLARSIPARIFRAPCNLGGRWTRTLGILYRAILADRISQSRMRCSRVSSLGLATLEYASTGRQAHAHAWAFHHGTRQYPGRDTGGLAARALQARIRTRHAKALVQLKRKGELDH